MTTQNERLLALLRRYGSRGVTPLDALYEVGSFRLGARVFDLRKQGHDIETGTFTTDGGARVACYVLRDIQAVTPTVETRQAEAWSEAELRLAYGDR
jgi:hypothetical protein